MTQSGQREAEGENDAYAMNREIFDRIIDFTPNIKIRRKGWKAEPVKHFLEVTHIYENGRTYSDFKEYVPREGCIDILLGLPLFIDHDKLVIAPCTIERLSLTGVKARSQYAHIPELEIPELSTYDLFVGIRGGNSVTCLGYTRDGRTTRKYFFNGDRPASIYLSGNSGPVNSFKDYPLESELVKYFRRLKSIRPRAADSLDACLNGIPIL